MRITLDELRGKQKPVIDLLEILSLEGQHYMARLSMEDQLLLLSEKNGTTSLFRSAWQIQDTLASFDVRETQIVHASAYNEMVGMEPSDVEPLRVRVQRQKT